MKVFESDQHFGSEESDGGDRQPVMGLLAEEGVEVAVGAVIDE